ncbi:AMP-binding protein [Williamsia sp. MIQD14]|uniref:AMP-binding protein n=1 Tax=Williamsia sp. MIQD14 TaxID=3425703 RepID=UPI003DA16F72
MTEKSIGGLISGRAADHPGRVLVTDHRTGEQLTASELDRRSNRLSRVFGRLGVGTDDLVTVALPTSIEFVVACAAVWKCGATPQPLAPDLGTDERAVVERVARPALVVGAPPVDESLPCWPTGAVAPTSVPTGPVEDRWASSWKAPTSSGSTGTPKVVAATAPARFDPDAAAPAFLPRSAVALVTGPMWHSATFTYAFRGLMTDHSLVLADPLDVAALPAVVAEHRVTWMMLTPHQIHRLVRSDTARRSRADLDSLETVLHLGAPCPEADKRALIDLVGARRVVEIYAGSESNGLTMIDGVDWLRHPGSVGRPLGDTELCIRRADGSRAEPGEIGEIWMRRSGGTRYRYLGADSHRDAAGWDTLGDIGVVDDDGWLHIVDRRTRVVTCGTTDIYPTRLEQGIVGHPAVRDAVVYGARARNGDPRLCAVVDIGDAQVGRHTVAAFTRAHLAAHCATGTITVRRAPVRNAAGKVRRSSLPATVAAVAET